MPVTSRPAVLGIAEETLEFAREAARDSHPAEYLGILRGTKAGELGLREEGLVISDILIIPGTETGPVSASLQTNMVPNDNRTVGSVHSHPNGVLRPSDEDKSVFSTGSVHIILGAPYERDDWRAFDRQGEPRSLDVLDVTLPDPESFFDFTQADIDRELNR
ncbi:MAG: Mov34/MPN/PAD-1 family protein [Halodesulfurarchaeum sp.]